MASKVIVLGDVEGEYPTVFRKLAALQSKNNFAVALIVGNLFKDPQFSTPEDDDNLRSLLDGSLEIPLPTYFALGSHALPEKVIEKLEASAGEVCSNLYFLGKRTTIKTSEGIRIVAVGGTLDPAITVGLSKDKYTPFYTVGDAKAQYGANTADILITTEWPAGIRNRSKAAFASDIPEPQSQQCIADLCATLKPRYHFSLSPNAFYEREPFFHQPTEKSPDVLPITRFISLGAYNNPQKAKWLYAFSIDPHASAPVSPPAGSTASPLSATTKKRPLDASSHPSSYSRFSSDDRHSHRPHKRNRQPPPTPAECFFCLSNPNLATHLITSIAEDSYLTTAKGPLTTSTTFSSLPFPGHTLIIPLSHAPTLAAIPDPAAKAATYAEMQRYRGALHAMLSARAGPALAAVTWEVSRGSGVHAHWQFLPIAADLVRRGLVEAAFRVEAENLKYPRFVAVDAGDGDGRGDFFRVAIWCPPASASPSSPTTENPTDGDKPDSKPEGEHRYLTLPLTPDIRFDMQFGRRVLAKLLGLEARTNWKDCGQAHDEEVADAEAFKAAFKAFDFSLEEE